jgi:hypothetical protein
MAITPQGAALTETHRLIQARIAAQTTVRTMAAWKALDPTNLDASAPAWLTRMVGTVVDQRSKSTLVAASYLQSFRAIETGGAFTPVLAPPIVLAQLVTSLKVTGPIGLKTALAAGSSLSEATDAALSNVAGAAMRHTLNGGRETIVNTVAADPEAYGWARATSGNTCAFCAMLASRGPVYSESTVDFLSHDHCACTGEPAYSYGSAWPAGAEEFRKIWEDSTSGLGGAEARAAFADALGGDSGGMAKTAKITVKAPASATPAGTVSLRDTVTYMTGGAEQKFGPTLDRLSELHGAAASTIPKTTVLDGGKATNAMANVRGMFSPSLGNPSIVLWDSGEGDGLTSFLHEYGHQVDYLGESPYGVMGGDHSTYASIRSAGLDSMKSFRKAVAKSTTMQDAHALYGNNLTYLDYYRSNTETWARAYSQWASNKLGGNELRSLHALQAASPGYMWTDEEFGPIGVAVEAVLRERGLMAA